MNVKENKKGKTLGRVLLRKNVALKAYEENDKARLANNAHITL